MREQARLEAERDMLRSEMKHRRASNENVYVKTDPPPMRNGPDTGNLNPRMRAFLNDMIRNNRKIVEVTYDRVKQHDKELTVIRGEYLEVSWESKINCTFLF